MKDLQLVSGKWHRDIKNKIALEYSEKFGSNSQDYAEHLKEMDYSYTTSCDNSLYLFYLHDCLVVSVGPDGIDFFLEI